MRVYQFFLRALLIVGLAAVGLSGYLQAGGMHIGGMGGMHIGG